MDITDKIYVPSDLHKDFTTISGCHCKDEYYYTNEKKEQETAKNRCAVGHKGKVLKASWCETKGTCGNKVVIDNKEYYWDKCVKERRSQFLGEEDREHGPGYYKRNLLGILFYVGFFMVLVPIFLFRNKQYDFLEVYMPNFDLLATSLTFQNATLGSSYFQELYNQDSQNILGYGSTLLINYISLLSLTYIVSHRVKDTESFAKGWAFSLVMLVVTFLLPNVFIRYVQNKIGDILQNTIDTKEINKKLGRPGSYKFWPFGFYNIIIVGVGLFMSYGFIRTEKFLLKHHKKWLDPFVRNIVQFTTI